MGRRSIRQALMLTALLLVTPTGDGPAEPLLQPEYNAAAMLEMGDTGRMRAAAEMTIVLPPPRRPAPLVGGVEATQLAPVVAKEPINYSVLRAVLPPDNKLVELIETPRDQILSLNVGRGQLLGLRKAVSDVLVADPNIADVRIVSPTKLFVFGNKLGRTNIFGIGDRDDVIFAIDLDVVPCVDGSVLARVF